MVHDPGHRPRRRTVTPDEARVWRAVIADVAPLPGRAADLPPEPPPPAAEPADPAPPPAAPPSLRPPPVRGVLPELGHGAAPGLDRQSARRMKRGELAIDGRLDLHGLTQDLAHGALTAFITRAYESGRRCVLVITGKGMREGSGILRANVPRWLNQPPLRERIIGFSHAQGRDGGEGALYVLIRRKRQ
ncbi:Smr/MutS family protein [Magnetospirillum sp. UT-4]|uniref:Smr/MutS family protein n=1 Tax=Magnetospirillum sp. UT-4 TaxID=2681467 RepID=UPI00138166A5|nr:Smr/MutS family protein [Magnetospirillum sp. UT-4]CAA7621910.1 Smr protein/MutS2 C-terminal [Magnetospirillum sp. UT-4]